MSYIRFDTLGAARKLEAAGVEPKHAEAIATVIKLNCVNMVESL